MGKLKLISIILVGLLLFASVTMAVTISRDVYDHNLFTDVTFDSSYLDLNAELENPYEYLRPAINENMLDLVKQLTCHDSDDGINLAEKGGYFKDGKFVEDECHSNTLDVYETICTPECNCQRIWMRCKFGTHCVEGKCVQRDFIGDDSDTELEQEWDLNIFEKGHVIYDDPDNNPYYEDYCIDDKTVREFKTSSMSAEIECPVGMSCVDGACIGDVNCEPLVPGHNQVGDERFNIVVVGTDYLDAFDTYNKALEMFKWDAKRAMGMNGMSYGLFAIEPFKSNKDKFNVWYVDRFVDADPFAAVNGTWIPEETERRNKAQAAQSGLSSACQYDHKITVSLDALHGWNTAGGTLINFATYRHVEKTEQEIDDCVQELQGCYDAMVNSAYGVDLNNDGCIGGLEEVPHPNTFDTCHQVAYQDTVCQNDDPERLRELCKVGNIGEGVAHEFAHVFGLADVFAASEDDLDPDQVEISPSAYGTYPNCFAAFSEEDCEDNAPWKWLLGNGCGEPGVIDCGPEDLDYNKEVVCQRGCLWNVKSYRSIRYSIMPYGLALSGLVSRPTHVLGEWNEYYIDKKIKAYLDIGLEPTAPSENLPVVEEVYEEVPNLIIVGPEKVSITEEVVKKVAKNNKSNDVTLLSKDRKYGRTTQKNSRGQYYWVRM